MDDVPPKGAGIAPKQANRKKRQHKRSYAMDGKATSRYDSSMAATARRNNVGEIEDNGCGMSEERLLELRRIRIELGAEYGL